MCTYETFTVAVEGAGKGASGWFDATLASVSFDHPVRAQADHSLNIDLLAPALGPSARVAIELTAESARALWFMRPDLLHWLCHAQDERSAMEQVMALQPLFEGLIETSLIGPGQRRERRDRSFGA